MDVVSVLVLRALSTFSDIYDYAHLVCLGSLRETKLSRKKTTLPVLYPKGCL